MSLVRQFLIGAAITVAALALWVLYLPSAHPFLARTGLLELIGVEPPAGEAAAPGGPRQGAGGARVITAAVSEGVVNDVVSAIGDGRAVRSVTIRAEATGRIAAIDYAAASFVEAGSVILRLDDEAERIALERANLVLAEARAEVDRLSQLEGAGAVTAVRFREADAALRAAELGLREAEFALERRVIRAPFPGWIGLLDVEEGDRVSAQDTLAVITDRSTLVIDFRVPERVIDQLEEGMSVEVAPLADRATVLEGRIAALDNVVDRASRTLRVQATIANTDDRLRAGMAFSVRLGLTGERLPALDPLAIQWSSEGAFVWAVREGAAVRVPVIIRERTAGSVLVEADLAIGEAVVTEGVQTLRAGAPVEVVSPATDDGARAEAPAPSRG